MLASILLKLRHIECPKFVETEFNRHFGKTRLLMLIPCKYPGGRHTPGDQPVDIRGERHTPGDHLNSTQHKNM